MIAASSVRLVAALALLAPLSCRHLGAQRYKAEPVGGDGVRVDLVSARAKNTRIELELTVHNLTDKVLAVDRNQVAVVTPEGDNFRAGDNSAFGVAAQGKVTGRLEVERAGADFDTLPGFFIRFDGLYIDGARVNLAPMKVGTPTGEPGTTVASFSAPAVELLEVSGGGLIQSLANAPRKLLGTRPTQPSAAQAQAPKSSAGYTGPRQMLKKPGTKLATMPMQTIELPKDLGEIIDEMLLTELQAVGFEAIGREDINALLGFERMKDAVACDDASCAAEVGGALGVDFLATGKAAKLESSTVVTLKLLAVRDSKVIARSQKVIEGGQDQLPRIIGEAVQELVQRSSL